MGMTRNGGHRWILASVMTCVAGLLEDPVWQSSL